MPNIEKTYIMGAAASLSNQGPIDVLIIRELSDSEIPTVVENATRKYCETCPLNIECKPKVHTETIFPLFGRRKMFMQVNGNWESGCGCGGDGCGLIRMYK